MDTLHAQGDRHFDIGFDVINKKDFSGFYRGPLDGSLKDLDGRLFKPHLVR